MQNTSEWIKGTRCPACKNELLFVAEGGYISCSWATCPNPDYADALEARIAAERAEARLDERKRVTYEHESFSKEFFKGNVIDVKAWYLETIVDAHNRRIAELTAQSKPKEKEES